MLNQTVIIGRLVADLTVKKTDNGREVVNCTLAVPRTYRDNNGEYQTDFIPCVLWNGIAKNTAEYCKKGDLISIKGTLHSKQIETKSGDKISTMELIAEKITFLSNQKTKEKDDIAKKEKINI